MKITSKYEKGFAAVGIIAVVLIIAAVGGASYFVLNKNKDTSTESTITKAESKAVEAECKKEIDDKDFCKFASNWDLSGEYRMTSTSTGGEAGKFVSEVDDKKNSYTVITSGTGEEMKTIYLDGASYNYDSANQTWIKYPAAETTEPAEATEDFSEELDFDDSDLPEAEKPTYKPLGKEACGNDTCFKYQIIDPTTPSLEQYLWFDDKDYQMRRYVTIEDGVTTEMTIEKLDVNISEPSPVTEYDPNAGLTQEQIDMMSQYLDN